MNNKRRYEGGLKQLEFTRVQVKEMQEELRQLQPALITAAEEVQQILARVEKEQAEVAQVEKVVKVDEESAMVRERERERAQLT